MVKQSREAHGLSRVPEHGVWRSMKGRCYKPSNKEYHNYGGRGIQICERWRNSFTAFYSDMGPRPTPKHSIERIDNNGNYEPSNCKWATDEEQRKNKRTNRRLVFNEQDLTMAEWTELLGFGPGVILARLNRGWTVAKALTTPLLTAKEKQNHDFLQTLRE